MHLLEVVQTNATHWLAIHGIILGHRNLRGTPEKGNQRQELLASPKQKCIIILRLSNQTGIRNCPHNMVRRRGSPKRFFAIQEK